MSPVKHFLLTNRAIEKRQGQPDKISENGKEEASDLFRVAEWNGKDFDLIADTAPNVEVHYTDLITPTTSLAEFTGSKRLFYELYKMMAFDGGGDVLLYIHGFNNDMNAVRGTMKTLIELYAENSLCPVKQIVIFSWPAENDIRYRSDYRDAKISGYTLARATVKYGQFLDEFFGTVDVPLNPTCGKRLHLMCHSMGNFVFENMVAELRSSGFSKNIFNQIILTAPDVAYDVFEDNQPFSRVTEYCDRTCVYFNNNDRAMFVSSTTKNPATRLGTNGPRLASQVPVNVVLIDTTDVARIGVSLEEKIVGHSYHMSSVPVIADMRQVLAGIHSEEILGRNFIAHKNVYRLGPPHARR